MAHTANDRPDIVDAISLLARERDISEEMLLSTVEEACKAAFRKNCKNTGAPMNLSVVIARKKPVQVFARKIVVDPDEIEDEGQQITIADAQDISPNYQIGDIVEIDLEAGTVTGPNGVIQSNPLSESVLKTLEYGGLIPRVRAELGIE